MKPPTTSELGCNHFCFSAAQSAFSGSHKPGYPLSWQRHPATSTLFATLRFIRHTLLLCVLLENVPGFQREDGGGDSPMTMTVRELQELDYEVRCESMCLSLFREAQRPRFGLPLAFAQQQLHITNARDLLQEHGRGGSLLLFLVWCNLGVKFCIRCTQFPSRHQESFLDHLLPRVYSDECWQTVSPIFDCIDTAF